MLLSISTFLPPLVAACQSIGLFGAVAVVAVACFLEVTDR